jgi:hypothetical protein
MGNNTNASNASGQQSTNKMHQPINRTSAFMPLPKEHTNRSKSFNSPCAPACLLRLL